MTTRSGILGKIGGEQHQPAMHLVRCDLRIAWAYKYYSLFFGRTHTPAGGMYGLIRYTTSALTNPQIMYWIVQINSPTYHLVSNGAPFDFNSYIGSSFWLFHVVTALRLTMSLQYSYVDKHLPMKRGAAIEIEHLENCRSVRKIRIYEEVLFSQNNQRVRKWTRGIQVWIILSTCIQQPITFG